MQYTWDYFDTECLGLSVLWIHVIPIWQIQSFEMDRLDFSMDFKYLAKQATKFSGKLTHKYAYTFKNSTSLPLGKTKLFWKENPHTKKQRHIRSVKHQNQYSRYKNEIKQTNGNHLSSKWVLHKMMYKSFSCISSSCFSWTSIVRASDFALAPSSLYLQSRGQVSSLNSESSGF